jgi:hypothetical protein
MRNEAIAVLLAIGVAVGCAPSVTEPTDGRPVIAAAFGFELGGIKVRFWQGDIVSIEDRRTYVFRFPSVSRQGSAVTSIQVIDGAYASAFAVVEQCSPDRIDFSGLDDTTAFYYASFDVLPPLSPDSGRPFCSLEEYRNIPGQLFDLIRGYLDRPDDEHLPTAQ